MTDRSRSTSDTRRSFLRKLSSITVCAAGTVIVGKGAGATHLPETAPDRKKGLHAGEWPAIESFKKIDIHTHISTDADYLREVMEALNLKMFTICNEGLKVDRLAAQVEAAKELAAHPRYYAWATTFGFDGMYDAGWHDQVIAFLRDGFEHDALAVKIWKEIGMEVRDREGRLVQVDDPHFDPILAYVASEGKTLFSHTGDPVHRWLSFGPELERDGWYREGAGLDNRVGRFRGEIAYDAMMLARDRMLHRHPELRVVGCHLGSMAFDVDLVADRLDRFPNLAVETSSATGALMDQAREKVRSLFLRYQDRILYGADISGGVVPTPYLIDMSRLHERKTPAELDSSKQALMRRYRADLAYYATDRPISRRGYVVRGLALSEAVLNKIFYENAVRWVPGIDQGH